MNFPQLNDPKHQPLLEVIASVELSQEILYYHLFKHGILEKSELRTVFDGIISDAQKQNFGEVFIMTLTRIRDSFNHPPLDPFSKMDDNNSNHQRPDWLRGIKLD